MVSLLPMRAEAASTRRGGATLVGPIDAELAGEGITIVLGPNGAGKTSLLRLLHGIARTHGGRVVWNCPLRDARRRQSFVFQRPVMLRRTVLQNVVYPLQVAGIQHAEAERRATEWLARVGLDHLSDRAAPDLSGGEGQKLALARALVTDPALVFLDEPCASLDGRATRDIEAILTDAAASGVRLVMSTHDLGQARRLADEVWFLHRGLLREAAPASRFFASPDTDEARAFLRGDIVE